MLEINRKQFECSKMIFTKFARLYANSQQSNNKCSKSEYDAIMSEKNKDFYESIIRSELNCKNYFTISIFKSLIKEKNDEVLRDILKDDYVRSTYYKLLSIIRSPSLISDKPNHEIPPDLIQDLSKKWGPNLELKILVKEKDQLHTLKVFFYLLDKCAKLIHNFNKTIEDSPYL
jgi:hypothetical protein